jgi:hypothetical protein
LSALVGWAGLDANAKDVKAFVSGWRREDISGQFAHGTTKH